MLPVTQYETNIALETSVIMCWQHLLLN